MKTLLTLLLILLSCATVARASEEPTGIELLQECQAATVEHPTATDDYRGSHCIGYLAGVTDTLRMWEYLNKDAHAGKLAPPTPLACIPDAVTRFELVKVVVKYLDDNPKELHLGYAPLVYLALWDAYPCK